MVTLYIASMEGLLRVRVLSRADDTHKSSMMRYDRSRLKRPRPIGPTERLERLLLVVADFWRWIFEFVRL